MNDRRRTSRQHGRLSQRAGGARAWGRIKPMAALRRAGRWLATLQHVPPVMLRDRLLYRLRCRYYRSALWGMGDALAREGLPEDQRSRLLRTPPLLDKGDAAAGRLIGQGQWTFVGVMLPWRHVKAGAGSADEAERLWMDWHPRGSSDLWRFNLHYFEWLADLRAADDRALAQKLVSDWLTQHGRWHPLAWHPYPLSLRVVAWLSHAEWLLDGLPDEEKAVFYDSLRQQVWHLSRNQETWLGGNHLIKNLKAMVMAGACLPGAADLLMPALARLLREVAMQVHADGGHYERSPWYHGQVLADLLAVQALLKKQSGGTPAVLNSAIKRMGLALAHWRHPDGALALFNDGAIGHGAQLERWQALAGVADVTPPAWLPETGFARLERGPMVVLCDVGGIAPSENPGHAHAETLSFELSVQGADGQGMRVLGNSGTFAYQDRLRNQFRGTAAHSTVTVDHDNSADVWAVFRVGRRPEEVTADLKDTPGGDMSLTALHDGYRHRGVLHRRQWLLAADGSRLRGIDELGYDAPAWWQPWRRRQAKRRLTAHFHLHPAIRLTLLDEQLARLTLPGEMAGGGRHLLFRIQGSGRLMVRDGWYAPHFGDKQPSRVLTVMMTGGRTRSEVAWDVLREEVGIRPDRRSTT